MGLLITNGVTFSGTVSVSSPPPPPPNLWTWGRNNLGQLGQGDTTLRSSPAQVGTLSTWSKIQSYDHFLAIKSDGTLWTWGQNADGRLGTNDTVVRSSPVQVGALANWASVAAGQSGSFAIKTDGTLWAWGGGGGYLGIVDGITRSSPTQVGALTNWSSIAIRAGSAVAIKTDGTLWTWGSGGFGQLGLNDRVYRSSPTQIGTGTNWSKVGQGYIFALAIKTDGTLWSWGGQGGSSGGVLGINGGGNYRSSPVQVGTDTNWSTLAVGEQNVLAIRTNGTLWGWGNNTKGQLGLNLSGGAAYTSSPTQIGAGTTWLNVSAGYQNTIATKTDNSLWVWGYNNYGQLGTNDTVNKSSPVQIGSGYNWSTVYGGYSSNTALST